MRDGAPREISNPLLILAPILFRFAFDRWRRETRNMPPVISTIVMLRLFAQRERASMSAYFTNSLTPPTALAY
jgi:hypothetical protein